MLGTANRNCCAPQELRPLTKCNCCCYLSLGNYLNEYELPLCHGCACDGCPCLQGRRSGYVRSAGGQREYQSGGDPAAAPGAEGGEVDGDGEGGGGGVSVEPVAEAH